MSFPPPDERARRTVPAHVVPEADKHLRPRSKPRAAVVTFHKIKQIVKDFDESTRVQQPIHKHWTGASEQQGEGVGANPMEETATPRHVRSGGLENAVLLLRTYQSRIP